MANLQAMRVDEGGIWLRTPGGDEVEITAAEIKAQHDALGSKESVTAWLIAALDDALPSAGIGEGYFAFDYDEATGIPLELAVG